MSASRSSSGATNLRVGLAVAAAAMLLLATLTLVGPFAIATGQRLSIDFGYAGPIKKGAAVRVAGVVVGKVESVEFLAGQNASAGSDVMVRVNARFEDRAKPVLTSKAKFYVTTLGVLGEHYLDLAPTPGGTPLQDGAVVRGTDLARADLLLPRAAGLLELSDAMVEDHREDIVQLVRSLSSVLASLNQTLEKTDTEGLAKESEAVLADARAVLRALKVTLGDGSETRALIPQTARTLSQANRALGRVEQLPLEDTLAEGRAALGEGRQALASGMKTVGKVDAALDGIAGGPLVDAKRQAQLARTFEKTFIELEIVAARADRLLAKIERKEGAAGEAFHDKELVSDLKAVLKTLRESPMKLFLP